MTQKEKGGALAPVIDRRHRRSKEWGYAVEVRALKLLQRLYPNMRRQGSLGYTRSAADLVDEGYSVGVQVKGREATWIGKLWRSLQATKPGWATVLIVTQDKRGRPLLTMDLEVYVEQMEAGHARVDEAYERGRVTGAAQESRRHRRPAQALRRGDTAL